MVNSFHSSSLQAMLGPDDSDLNLVLGFFYQHLKKEIEVVKADLINRDNDRINDLISDEDIRNNKVCLLGHINVNPRAQRKYCSFDGCKAILQLEEDEQSEDEADTIDNFDYKRLKIDKSDKNEPVKVQFSYFGDKSKLYENVRNIYSDNDPVIESSGAVLVNPNTFSRVKKVFDYIINKSGLTGVYTHFIQIEDNDTVSVKPVYGQQDKRSYIVINCDGLPHLIGIDVIQNCFICAQCEVKLESIASITSHKKNLGHTKFYMQYGNVILRIGRFHLELNMHRSYVNLLWDIEYSQIAKFAQFVSPKAQLTMKKVSDFHKSTNLLWQQELLS